MTVVFYDPGIKKAEDRREYGEGEEKTGEPQAGFKSKQYKVLCVIPMYSA